MISASSAVGGFLGRSKNGDQGRTTAPGGMSSHLEDEDGPKAKITPLENVYSYYMFVMPIESQKSPGLTWNKGMACCLVFLTLLLQSILLFAIHQQVVAGDAKWRNTIMGSVPEPGQCNKGGSLCTMVNGTFTCAPPSVQLTGRWEELDTNGDGIWTRQEVEAAKESLQCKYVVNPVEVFDVFVQFLLKREKVIWLHPELKAGREIRKAYFTYASGDLIMCGYRNAAMCPNLLTRGIFNAPLRYGTAPRVGKTINSALEYCYGLLESGGTCERTLPSTYSVWRKSSSDQCLGETYDKAVYAHPLNNRTKSMLTVDYQAREDYAMAAKSKLFLVYKTIIIGMFLLAMFFELKDLVTVFTWVFKYPSSERFSGDAVRTIGEEEEGQDVKYCIQGISRAHRFTVGLITFFRLLLIVVLTSVGVTFLQKDTDWVNLLLNAVALIFVLEIANNLYTQVLNGALKELLIERTEPMEVSMFGSRSINESPALKDFIGAFLLLTIVACVMLSHYFTVGKPLSRALECACVSQGEHCHEASAFSNAFWDKYWLYDVPAVFEEVRLLKLATLGADPSAAAIGLSPGVAPAPAPSPGGIAQTVPQHPPPATFTVAAAEQDNRLTEEPHVRTYLHHRRHSGHHLLGHKRLLNNRHEAPRMTAGT
mmetsp:Transcript_34058/g.67029  ORF Transcript_34058/g.67029 Transcript_34058/m.67029 type:complete len:652 (-) Transcript_34058:70-2025(-)